jgi:hypothetical protein
LGGRSKLAFFTHIRLNVSSKTLESGKQKKLKTSFRVHSLIMCLVPLLWPHAAFRLVCGPNPQTTFRWSRCSQFLQSLS